MKGCTGNSLVCVWLRTFPTEFVSSHTETLVPLYSQDTSFQEQMCFLQGPTTEPVPAAPCPSWALSLLPASFHLGIWKMRGGNNPLWFNSALWFQGWQSGIINDLPTRNSCSKGFWILFYLHTPGTAASPNTDPSGQHQLCWLSRKSHQTLVPKLWQERDLEYVDNPGSAVEISHFLNLGIINRGYRECQNLKMEEEMGFYRMALQSELLSEQSSLQAMC